MITLTVTLPDASVKMILDRASLDGVNFTQAFINIINGCVHEEPSESFVDEGMDVDEYKVRETLTTAWLPISALAELSGLEKHVVRRICKSLVSSGEALEMQPYDKGAKMYRKASDDDQQIPQNSPVHKYRVGCKNAVLSSLENGEWTTLNTLVKRVSHIDTGFTKEQVYKCLMHGMERGDIERYPPVVHGRRPRVEAIQWRISKQEGIA